VTYLVLIDGVVHIPGDERSRTHPGHGYPAHTEKKITVKEFTDIDKLEQEIVKLTKQNKNFRVFKAEEIMPELSTSVNFKVMQ
jgi:preprotein translocase subunit SecA